MKPMLCAAFGLALASGCTRSRKHPEIPTHRVTTGELTRTIVAEGNLRAVHSTPVSPPQVPGAHRGMRLAWIAQGGVRVKKDEVVARFDPTVLRQQLHQSRSEHASASARLAKERIAAYRTAEERDARARTVPPKSTSWPESA